MLATRLNVYQVANDHINANELLELFRYSGTVSTDMRVGTWLKLFTYQQALSK